MPKHLHFLLGHVKPGGAWDVCSTVGGLAQALGAQPSPLCVLVYVTDQHFSCQKQRQKLPGKIKQQIDHLKNICRKVQSFPTFCIYFTFNITANLYLFSAPYIGKLPFGCSYTKFNEELYVLLHSITSFWTNSFSYVSTILSKYITTCLRKDFETVN